MYLLYLDDSGSPGNPNEDYFVLGGICVPEQSVRWLSHEIKMIASQYDSEHPEQLEFHAAETFRGHEAPWSSIPRCDRIKAIQNVLHSIDNAYRDTVLFACATHVKSFPNQDLVVSAYEDISSRFDIYLQRMSNETGTAQRGIIILDKSSYETGLQTLAAKIRRTGNRWGGFTSCIAEVPLFVDSRASRIVQLADHVAYAVFRRYNANDLTYFNVIESKFYQYEGVIHGLAHRQLTNKNCTCPACLSRYKNSPTSSSHKQSTKDTRSQS